MRRAALYVGERAGLVAVGVLACTPNPAPPPPYVAEHEPAPIEAARRKAGELTEREKILALIGALRKSQATVIRNGVEYSAEQGAEHLEMKLNYAGTRLKSAEQFIVHVATRSSMSGKPYFIRPPDQQEVLAGDWFFTELGKLSPQPAPATSGDRTPSPAGAPPSVRPPVDPINRALDLVAASDQTFVVTKNGRPSKTYDGPGFAAMLRTKTKWLGEGLDDYETWRSEIAARSFKTFEPYLVVAANGAKRPFTTWLERHVRPAVAQPQPKNAADSAAVIKSQESDPASDPSHGTQPR